MLNVLCALKNGLNAAQNRILVVVPQILEPILVKKFRREIGLEKKHFRNA
jgi:hypothetical protein